MWRAAWIFALFVAGAAPGASWASARPLDPAVERGRDLAERRCAECHATRYGRDSPDGAAPPFPSVGLRHNEISLARWLAGISRGEHAGMPPIALTADDRDDLAAFIKSFHPRRQGRHHGPPST